MENEMETLGPFKGVYTYPSQMQVLVRLVTLLLEVNFGSSYALDAGPGFVARAVRLNLQKVYYTS